MFLSKKYKLKNSYRHRRELMWDFFTQKTIKEFYLKKNYKNCNITKLSAYINKGFFFNKYNKKIYSIVTDLANNNIISSLKYGTDVGEIQTNKKYFYDNIINASKLYLLFIRAGFLVSNIKNNFNGNIYASSEGTFAIIQKHIIDLNLTELKLPSGNNKLCSFYNYCSVGRNGNIFKKYIVWGSWGFKFKNKNHMPIVRGVAMNPVDHPNGGRSKVKKPFKNKYNKIAKKGK